MPFVSLEKMSHGVRTSKRLWYHFMNIYVVPTSSLQSNVRWLSDSQNVRRDQVSVEATEDSSVTGEEQFRTIDLGRRVEKIKKERTKFKVKMLPPRYTKMSVNQDWMNVWPAARTYNPSVVPLPVYQGYTEKAAPPDRFGNLELMKIPNFLHLTPPAIQKHCEAIKRFCTPWPVGLETDDACEKHFPVEIITSDYCNSGSTIRDFRSRIVTLKVRLAQLKLDYHARDKLLRLLRDRYDPQTDSITLLVERCPMRKQNYDFAHYLLAALYHESKTTESWELEKSEADMEEYVWQSSRSSKTIFDMAQFARKESIEDSECLPWLSGISKDATSDTLTRVEPISSYAEAVTKLHNEGETEDSVVAYKECVKNLLNLPKFKSEFC